MAQTTTDLTTLKINYLTQSAYNTALAAGNIDDNQLYFISDTLPSYNITLSSTQPTSQSTGDFWYQIL